MSQVHSLVGENVGREMRKTEKDYDVYIIKKGMNKTRTGRY